LHVHGGIIPPEARKFLTLVELPPIPAFSIRGFGIRVVKVLLLWA